MVWKFDADQLGDIQLVVTGVRQAAELVRTATVADQARITDAWDITARLYALAGRIESDARHMLALDAFNASLIRQTADSLLLADPIPICDGESADSATAISLALPDVGTYIPPTDMAAKERADAVRSAAAILSSLDKVLRPTVFRPAARSDLTDLADTLLLLAADIE